MNRSILRSSVASLAMSALLHKSQFSQPVTVVDVEDPPKGDKMKIVDVAGAAPIAPASPSVGEAIQMSNDTLYYEEQLKIIASEIAEAKALDKMSRFRKTDRVKELLAVIKSHRKVIQNYIARYVFAAKMNKTIYPHDVHQQYVQDTKTIADNKLALFKEIRKFCADSGYMGKRQ